MQPKIFEEQGRCLTSAPALFIAALAVLAGLLFTPARPAHAYTVQLSAKTDPCRSERADWRKAQRPLVIGGHRPGDYWTAQARLLQCERAHIR